MEIKQLPENYASLRGELIYVLSDTAPRTFEATVIDADSDEPLGAKRFVDTPEARFDAAPYLRRRLSFLPATGPTGFLPAGGRTVQAVIEVGGVRSPLRTFVPAPEAIVPSRHLTTWEGTRTLAADECDELTFCTAAPCVLRLTAFTDGTPRLTVYSAPKAGYAVFRLRAADFAGAGRLRIEVPEVAQFDYTLDGPAGCRIAWRSSQGSIEHYTFPVVKEATDEVHQEGTVARDGYRPALVRSTRTLTLLSAYEPLRVRRALAEIVCSPSVWHVENGVYLPVEAVAAASGFRRRGSLENLELQIRHHPRTLVP